MTDVSFCLQGEFFGRSQRSPVPFDAPPIRLPQQHDHMAYFAVSQYVFNTASRVYHQAGHMNFTIRNEDVSRGWRRLGVQERVSDGTVDPLWVSSEARGRMWNLEPAQHECQARLCLSFPACAHGPPGVL